MNGYDVFNTFLRIRSFIYTKIFWHGARLVRLPIQIRNKKRIIYKAGFTTGVGCRINIGDNGRLTVGQNFVMGDYNQIEAMEFIEIGDNVLLASRIYIGDSSHGIYAGDIQDSPVLPPNKRNIVSKPITIGNNVWVGNGVSILPGVTIGDGVIIGANSVITKNVKSNCIVAGNPAKVLKEWSGDKWEIRINK